MRSLWIYSTFPCFCIPIRIKDVLNLSFSHGDSDSWSCSFFFLFFYWNPNFFTLGRIGACPYKVLLTSLAPSHGSADKPLNWADLISSAAHTGWGLQIWLGARSGPVAILLWVLTAQRECESVWKAPSQVTCYFFSNLRRMATRA